MLPIKYQQTHYTGIPQFQSRRPSISHGETQRTYSIVNMGSSAAEPYLFPNDDTVMRHVEIDATDYERSVSRLTQDERTAIRTWAAIDTETEHNERQYSDQIPIIEKSINYELNRALLDGFPIDRKTAKFVASLDSALQKLPHVRDDALCASEYSRYHPHPWGTKITIGDIVSSFPCYMSASHTTDYVQEALNGSLRDPHHTDTICIYKISTEIGAPPLMRGAVTYSHENEILFPRNSCFRVDAISIAQPIPDTSDLFKNRIAISLTQVHPQAIAKNIHSGNNIYITTDITKPPFNYSLYHYQDMMRESMMLMHNLDKTETISEKSIDQGGKLASSAPGTATCSLKDAFARIWSPDEINDFGKALQDSALSRDQIFQFLVSDDSECTSTLFSALHALHPAAMDEFRRTLQELDLSSDQIDYALGCHSAPQQKSPTASYAARTLAELISVACIDPQRAAHLFKSKNLDGEQIGNQIARVIEQEANPSLAGAYISLAKFLYKEKALDHRDIISALLPSKTHEKQKWLSHAIAGAAWHSEATSSLASLLSEFSKAHEDAASEIAFRLSLEQSGYSFKHTHHSLPADFYKLAKRAHQKQENIPAIYLLHIDGLIPRHRELSKVIKGPTSSYEPQPYEPVESLLSKTLNKIVPETIVTEKSKNIEIMDINTIKQSTLEKLRRQTAIKKEANKKRTADSIASALNHISRGDDVHQLTRARKIQHYESETQSKKIKQTDLTIFEVAPSTSNNEFDTAASGEAHSSGISQHHFPLKERQSPSAPSIEELEQRFNRLRQRDTPSERELAERLLRLREDRAFTKDIQKDLEPPLKRD